MKIKKMHKEIIVSPVGPELTDLPAGMVVHSELEKLAKGFEEEAVQLWKGGFGTLAVAKMGQSVGVLYALRQLDGVV